MKRVLLFASSLLLFISCGNNNNTTQNDKEETPPVQVEEPKPSLPLVYSNAYDGYTNIREQASSKSAVIGQLRNGTHGAELLGIEGDWSKVKVNNTVGYVYNKYIQSTPTIAVNPDITSTWLQGLWTGPGGYYFYLIFSNGTYAYVQQYGDMAYGTYHLEGDDIIFTHKHITEFGTDFDLTVGQTERYTIDVNNNTIGHLERDTFITEEELRIMEEEDMGGECVFTKADFDGYRNLVKKYIK